MRWWRHPRLIRHYPARFRTTRSQAWDELVTWVRDQLDAESRGFDREHGVHTSWFDLGNYEPTPPSVVTEILDALLPAASGATFVDLGSGKGRVVLMAGGRPFRAVVGVERRWMLDWRARRNLRDFRSPLACPVELVRADVRDYVLPHGPLVLFTYNPFPLTVLDGVLARVADREHSLVMVNPPPLERMEERGFTAVHHVEHPIQDRCWTWFRPTGSAPKPPRH